MASTWKPAPPCEECHSVGCHSTWCQTGQARLAATLRSTKDLQRPPADVMVSKAAVRK